MENKNDKFLFAGMVPVCLIIAIICMFIAVTATKGPQSLSSEEIMLYTETAYSVWNGEINPTASNLICTKDDTSVKIGSHNMFKETLTLSIVGNEQIVTTNPPHLNFLGCILFFSALASIAFVGSILFLVAAISEFKKPKDIRLTQSWLQKKIFEKEFYVN